jgi:hypothetical protein
MTASRWAGKLPSHARCTVLSYLDCGDRQLAFNPDGRLPADAYRAQIGESKCGFAAATPVPPQWTPSASDCYFRPDMSAVGSGSGFPAESATPAEVPE